MTIFILTIEIMIRMKSIIYFTLVTFSLVLLNSCSSGDGTQNVKDSLSAYINGNDQIMVFGSADIKRVLDKTDYKNIPKLGVLLDSEMSELNKMIDFSRPIYYAIEGPMIKGDTPSAIYSFVQVKSKEALIQKLSMDGFDFTNLQEIDYAEDGDFVLGVSDHIAIIISKQGEYEAEKLIMDAFSKLSGNLSGGSIAEILEEEGDIVMAVSVAPTYLNTNSGHDDLSKDKRKDIEELISGAYVQTVMKFEEGALFIESKNYFSDDLFNLMFFKEDKDATILDRLGSSEARLGVALNIDMKKMQTFANKYSSETMEEIANSMGDYGKIAFMTGGKDALATLFDGQLGAVSTGKSEQGDGFPDFNAYIGLTERGLGIAELGMMVDFNLQRGQLTTADDGAYFTTNSEYSNKSKKNNLILPNGCEKFGKSGISAFINFEDIDINEFDFQIASGERLLKIVNSITLYYNNEGGRIVLKAKNGKENILEQTVDLILKEFANELNSITI